MPTKGSFIKISYTGRVKETNELFDTTDEALARKEGTWSPRMRYGSVTIVLGEGRLLKGLDEAVLQMNPGEERSLEVPPEKAFGQRSNELVKLIPLQEFKTQRFIPQPGMPISMGNVRGRVLSVNSGRVRVDFNHPLAGKTVSYTVKLVEEVTDQEKQAAGVVEFYVPAKVDVKLVKDVCEVTHTEEMPQTLKQSITNDLKKYVSVKEVKFTQTMVAQAENPQKSS